jgi:hypothetical protein
LDFVELTLGCHQALDLIREALVFDSKPINLTHATGLSMKCGSMAVLDIC